MSGTSELVTRPPARRWALVAAGVALLGVIALAVWLIARESGSESQAATEPAVLEPVEGSELLRVRLTARATERLDLQTAAVRAAPGADGGAAIVPYSALLYDTNGATWVYTNPERLVFVRAPVEVDRIVGAQAFLSAAPPAGTLVVSVGAAELYGAELGVDH